MKAYLTIDLPDSVFHAKAREMCRGFQDMVDGVNICLGRDMDKRVEPDSVLISLWHFDTPRLKSVMRPGAVVSCVDDHMSFLGPNGRLSPKFLATLRCTDILAVGNEMVRDDIVRLAKGQALPPIIVTPNGVNPDLFAQTPLPKGDLVFGWTGNSQRMNPAVGGMEDYKGLGMFREAVERCKVPHAILDSSTAQPGQQAWPHYKMPEFYNQIGVIVCMSKGEGGGPFPIFEGMSCGCIPTSTKVGSAQLAINEDFGRLLPERTVDHLCAVIEDLRRRPRQELQDMADRAAAAIRNKWTWHHVMSNWRECLGEALRIAAHRGSPAHHHVPPPSAPEGSATIPVVVNQVPSRSPEDSELMRKLLTERDQLRRRQEYTGFLDGDGRVPQAHLPFIFKGPTQPGPVRISVISGTYNRLESLKRMVRSIRADFKVMDPCPFEFILSDGGSTDGTLEWLKEQPDCRVVHGGLTGAIDAFNLAYEASCGQYVFQANDDVELVPGSLRKAVDRLDQDPGLDQVCFEFSTDGGDNWIAPHHTGALRSILNESAHPNIALTRRNALEDVATLIGGFWGDSQYRIDRTYAGDTLQGAALVKAGRRAQYFPGEIRAIDHQVPDGLRRKNVRAYGPKHGDGSLDRLVTRLDATPPGDWWPRLLVPEPGKMPRRSPIPAGPEERLLLLPLAHEAELQIGLREAFGRIGKTVEVLRLRGDLAAAGPKVRAQAIFEAARQLRPTLVWYQIQDDEGFLGTAEFIQQLRKLCAPGAVIATWNGDVRQEWYPRPTRWMLDTGRAADLCLQSNIDYCRMLAQHEVPHPGYLQVGYDIGIDDQTDPDRIPMKVSQEVLQGSSVFIGSRTYDYDLRTSSIEALFNHDPQGIFIFGSGWTPDQTLGSIPRAACPAVYNLAALSVNASITPDLTAYSSDRLNRLGAASACIALQRFKGQEHWGIVDGKHALCWGTPSELLALAKTWAKPPGQDPEMDKLKEQMRRDVKALAYRWWSWEAVVEMFLAIVRHHRGTTILGRE